MYVDFLLKVIILPLPLAFYNGTKANNNAWRLIFRVLAFYFLGNNESFAGSRGTLGRL